VLEKLEEIVKTVTDDSDILLLWTEWGKICKILEQTSQIDSNLLPEIDTNQTMG
jgi:hypothetical protein